MTSEEMVVCVQNGNVSLIPELWERVERHIAYKAYLREKALNGCGGVTGEDLYQSGYFAFLNAIRDFEPERGFKFKTYLDFPLLTAFADATGYRIKRQRCDPIHSAKSLDMPIGDDEDSTLADFVADKTSSAPFEAVEHRDSWRRLSKALEVLTKEQRDVINLRYYHDLSREETARYLGVNRSVVIQNEESALKTLRSPRVRNKYKIQKV